MSSSFLPNCSFSSTRLTVSIGKTVLTLLIAGILFIVQMTLWALVDHVTTHTPKRVLPLSNILKVSYITTWFVSA